MKSYGRVLLITALILGAAVLAFFLLANKTDTASFGVSGDRIVTLNRIVHDAEEQRGNLSALDGAGFDVRFAIIDRDDRLLYACPGAETETEDLSLERAMQRRYPYRVLTDNGKVWGTVILIDDGTEAYRSLVGNLMAAIAVFCLLVMTAAAGYGIYVHRNIIVPFRNLQGFAARVAQGDLNTPLEMNRDNMFGAFTESFDIMREELAGSKERELALQKKEKELVASLSHDLKTPVTGIKLTAELMQMRLSVKTDGGDGDVTFSGEEIGLLQADAQGILGKADQIDTLVSDLFTSTLDDLGEFRVNCRDEDSGILGDIVRDFDDRGLAVSGEIPAVIINTDRKRMSQVIGNILSNSYKYANTRIDIDYRLAEHYLEMRISDRGPGVPADEIDLITNKFYRGKEWENTEKDGHGLGLYIAKNLMKRMNGDLIALSDGGGLAITLIIPLS